MSNNQLTRTHNNVLKALAESSPQTREALETSNRTLAALEAAALISSETQGEGEEARTLYTITESGLAAIAKPEKPAKPAMTISKTLFRCLSLLEDGEWHSAGALNTSHQNHGRLVDMGFAKVQREEDGSKKFQITKKGVKELETNRNLLKSAQ